MHGRFSLKVVPRLVVAALAVVVTACGSLPDVEEVSRTPSYALSDPGGTRLHDSLKPLLASHPGQSGFLTLAAGEEAFISRLRMVAALPRVRWT